MPGTLTGYARCSTDIQDFTARRDRLFELGVTEERICLDHGSTGTKRQRPAWIRPSRQSAPVTPSSCRNSSGSPARSRMRGRSVTIWPRGIQLSLGGQVYDPHDPMGMMFFDILTLFAEFEVDLLRMRTRAGMTVARAEGRLRGHRPELSADQRTELRRMHATGEYTITDLGELSGVSRPTVYRALHQDVPTVRGDTAVNG